VRAFTDSWIGDPSWKGSDRMLVLSSMSISAKGGYKRDALPWSFAFVQNGLHRAARGRQARRARGREDSRSRTRRCEEGTPQRGNWRTELMHTKRHARNVIIANL